MCAGVGEVVSIATLAAIFAVPKNRLKLAFAERVVELARPTKLSWAKRLTKSASGRKIGATAYGAIFRVSQDSQSPDPESGLFALCHRLCQ
jgi:hypothetical protein